MLLYLIDNNQLIWPARPKYKVFLSGITRCAKLQLVEGELIKANLFFSKINNFYVAYKYGKYLKKKTIKTRLVLETEDNCGVTEVSFCLLNIISFL